MFEKEIEKECGYHGITIFSYEKSNKRYKCKKCRTDGVARRRLAVKQKAVDYKGGCCAICGYNKCIGALDFHHLEDKKFAISANGHTHSWDKIQVELDKCILLCANCHREKHYAEYDNQRIELLNRRRKFLSLKDMVCLQCNKFFQSKRCKQKFCSTNCGAQFRRKNSKNLSKDELQKMLWEKPTTQIAKNCGVSDNAIGKLAKKWNLTKPPRGYWQKNKSA